MTDNSHTQQQRRSEYELADLLEDETLRFLDDLYHDSLSMPELYSIQVKTIYSLILNSSTAFDALVLVQHNDGDIIGEVARDWLLDYGMGSGFGDYFCERIFSRIQDSDYTLKED